MQTAFGYFKFLISTESIPSLKSKIITSQLQAFLFMYSAISYFHWYLQSTSENLTYLLSFLSPSWSQSQVYPFKYSPVNIHCLCPCRSLFRCIRTENPWFNLTISPLYYVCVLWRKSHSHKIWHQEEIWFPSLIEPLEPISSALHIPYLPLFPLSQTTLLFTFTIFKLLFQTLSFSFAADHLVLFLT